MKKNYYNNIGNYMTTYDAPNVGSIKETLFDPYSFPDYFTKNEQQTTTDYDIKYDPNDELYFQDLNVEYEPEETTLKITTEKDENGNTKIKYTTKWEPKSKSMSKYEYTNMMKQPLRLALINNGIDPDMWTNTLIAHTAHESGWGNKWSRTHNNFAGIKGKGSGLTYTKELVNGLYKTISDEFKHFNSIEEFADQYVKMLKNKFHAFDGEVNTFADRLKQNHYFTDDLNKYRTSILSTTNSISLF